MAPTDARMTLEFAILGPLEVRRNGRALVLGRGHQRRLLAMLVLRANEFVSTDRLIEQLWGEQAPVDAANALQVHVSRLRRALTAGGALETGSAGYRLLVAAGGLDAARFEAMVQDGRDARAGGRLPDAGAVLREALALWRGAALADCAYDGFAQPEIARLEELRLAAFEELMEVELARGHVPVAELERLVAEHPLRERLRGQLMTALYRGGRQAEALAAYHQGREALMDQLGLEPSPALRRLEGEILRHELRVATEPRGVPLARPLVEAREARIVGRHAELERARAALASARPCVVLVEAEPGMGKTRLLAELAHEAHGAGQTVLYGRAEACSPIPYQPFVEALRHHVAHDATLDAVGIEPELAAVADVVPELRGRLPPLAGPAPDWRLFTGLAALVAQLARTGPLLLVLDDLHHAEPSTLRLLRHLLRSGTPLAVLGASRDEAPRDALAGHGRSGRIRLAGLGVTAARELAGTPDLWELTGGNPLLLEELQRERAVPRLRQRVPERVQALLAPRLARIDDPHGALAAAAIAGAEFDLELVEAALRAPAGAVLDVVEQAIAARIVVELRAGRFRFTPPLVREALRERVSETRRARLEGRLAELGRGVPRAA